MSGDEDKEETPFKSYEGANGVNGEGEGKSKDDDAEAEKEKDEGDESFELDEDGNPILPEGMGLHCTIEIWL